MIRPSALQLAQHCSLSPVLAKQFPESSSHAKRGHDIHDAVVHVDATVPAAQAAIAWLDHRRAEGWSVSLEEPVQLLDDDGSVITKGTADAVLRRGAEVEILDWKSGLRKYVAPVNENLQLIAYALAVGARRWHVGFLSDNGMTVSSSEHIGIVAADRWLARIKEIVAREPEATIGAHCFDCWASVHCSAYQLPVSQAETALAPLTEPGGLNSDNAAKALLTVQALEELAERARAALRAFAAREPINLDGRTWGPWPVAGRQSVDTEAMKRDGIYERYSKQGKPSTRFEWRKQ